MRVKKSRYYDSDQKYDSGRKRKWETRQRRRQLSITRLVVIVIVIAGIAFLCVRYGAPWVASRSGKAKGSTQAKGSLLGGVLGREQTKEAIGTIKEDVRQMKAVTRPEEPGGK